MNIYILIVSGLFMLYGLILLLFDGRKRSKTDFYLRKHPGIIVIMGLVILAVYLVTYYFF